MSREIRFRAWVKQSKKMAFFTGEVWITTNSPTTELTIGLEGWIAQGSYQNDHYNGMNIPHGEFELMQYTGLKDKNGTEIYEGDILKAGETIAPCVWDEEYAQFIFDTPKMSYFGWDILTIIGNIYENPELLEQSK